MHDPRDGGTGFSLPPRFWAEFCAANWERAPRLIDQPFARPIATSHELFDALVAAAGAFRATRDVTRRAAHRFSVRHAPVINDVERYLARPDDRSLDGYVARVEREVGGEPFELLVDDIQEHSLPVWERLSEFARDLYRQAGLPTLRAEAGVFLRCQDATSFGVHRDASSVFMFPLHGRKRILTWHPQTFADENATSTLDYERFRAAAVVLDTQPGDIAYWPSSYWHVGEAGPDLSVSLNFGLHLTDDPLVELRAALRLLAKDAALRAEPARFANYPLDLYGDAAALPDDLRRVADAFRGYALDGSLDRALALVRLVRATGRGFTRTPPAAPPSAVGDDDLVQVREPIAWTAWQRNTIACCVNGRSFSISDRPAVASLLERLAPGRTHVVRALLDECVGDDAEARAFLRVVLNRIAALRGIGVLEPVVTPRPAPEPPRR